MTLIQLPDRTALTAAEAELTAIDHDQEVAQKEIGRHWFEPIGFNGRRRLDEEVSAVSQRAEERRRVAWVRYGEARRNFIGAGGVVQRSGIPPGLNVERRPEGKGSLAPGMWAIGPRNYSGYWDYKHSREEAIAVAWEIFDRWIAEMASDE